MTDNNLQKKVAELEAQIRKLKKNNLGLVFEDKQEDVVEQSKTQVPVLKEVVKNRLDLSEAYPNNLMIEGDNYLALSVLNYTHKKNIDLIYIDPPYNTGAKNWKYNNDYVDKDDEYRHSKWLSFMRHRLNLAKNLLKDDGVLICAIDENEQAHLGVLIEQLFPAHEQHTITIVHNPRGVQGTNFSYTHEYAVFVIPKNLKTIGDRVIDGDDVSWRGLRDNGGESLRTDARNCFYPIIIKDGEVIGFGNVVPNDIHPNREENKKDGTYIYPIDNEGIERKWRYARQSVEKIKHLLRVADGRGGKEIQIGKDFGKYRTVWFDKKYDANEYGAKLLREIVPSSDFDYPKSLHTVYDCLFAVVGERPHANVLDFFAGSGTTGHAVLEMNKIDGGNRKFIICTNNENNNGGNGGIAESVCYPRIKAVIKGYKNKKGEKVAGMPSNLFYYQTDLVDIEQIHKVPDDAKIRITYEAGEMIAVREDTLNEVEKNDWWQIFEGKGKLVAIYFKEDKAKLAELIAKLEKKNLPTALYIFSWGKNEYKGEYSSANIRVEDIPEPIIEVYKELNRI
ncbi:MAG: type III restriction endonuclease subunit M [Candidatus Niyogibacteria bacterium CG10_big_fil_rev_8_21_14_0_10_46_36]|uniref:Type III restriction endonuclease subunit M n=1 Tax=Candidatus Niyogibacteria bacterium CG10_big_fil_rev_8_21_14_0_10_46_36 TaxID=1974726 RepID=A0A2H0TGB7_9BACT|nr:MAG: type III restriction endonuclease subunit M [Candidatus Niyogibacteria bacterium CG10_big_fil_rev_8_21_14_0_10_46_36]